MPPAWREDGEGPQTLTGLLPEGFRDRLPPQAEAAAALLRTLLDTVAARGYARVQPPLVEFETGLSGWLMKPASTALLRATDPASGLGLALRPDITGQIARIAATRLADAPRPLRLAYGGPVLRAKGGQLNPAREFLQAGAELIGSDSLAAATEILTMAVAALAAAGVTDISVDLTLPELVATLAADRWPVPCPLADLHAALDAKDAGALPALGATAYAPLLAAAGPAAQALARLRALDLPVAPQLDALESLAAALPGTHVTIDPTERHGFEYHSWLGFSLFGRGPEGAVRGEIGRGGSYAVRHSNGTSEAAVGFSLYVDALVDAGLGITRPRRLFLPHGTPSTTADTLRAQGWATVAALSPTDTPQGCSHVWNGVEAAAL
ncbi:ATP phosphoribosyltransferase regulatory subunit [Sandaracinobacteroides saxicola]|uniref:Histidine--tRNA ligase n=1 Tax=Sandaracinobacteroides saxicola TaxID=2759707 RepID=A0A7G5IJT2_9SPHN|nr:ATP phosphoribosyltransferase regulatory subunit [Sandaracinobacteroides saxicola]